MGCGGRRWVVAGWAVGTAMAGAQMHHVDKPERVTRAVGVYEWTGELDKPTAERFVPVSLFIDGRFEDAGLYLARPVPFALESGDLYTVERSGEPQGVLDLQMAERVVTGNALADDNPAGVWYGFGKFTAESAAAKPVRPLRQYGKPAALQVSGPGGGASSTAAASAGDAGDGRPVLGRRGNSGSTSSGDAGDSGSTGTTASSGSSSSDDTDRPTLARRDPSQDASRRRDVVNGGKRGAASVTAVGPSPGDDPDRPTLTHKTAAEEGPKELTGLPADLHQAVAVSDPVSRDPHEFARGWEDGAERTSVLAAMEALAKPRVAAYLAANGLVAGQPVSGPAGPQGGSTASSEGIAADTATGAGAAPKLQRGKPAEYSGAASPQVSKPATPQAGATTAARRNVAGSKGKPAAAPPLVLLDAAVRGFTLTYGGLPTFVYTASVPVVERTGMAGTAYVTVVAQRLPSGELQVALAQVTDSAHLDRSGRLRLIDAVDPDASHRASLLFEVRGNGSRQFALYRLVTARAENVFTSASIE